MKTVLLALVLGCQASHAFGQARVSQLPKEQASDTVSFWYSWTKEKEQQLGLEPLHESSRPFYFRITNGGLILDIWQTDSLFEGRLTRWVKDADEELRPFERFYCQKYILGTDQATAVGQFVKTVGILQLPSEENIVGWQQGLDGEEIIIQHSTATGHYLKNYWTPSAQHGLTEAVLVQQVYTKVLALANAATVQQAFEASIPFRCYTTDNGSVTCRVTRSSAEYWRYKNEVSQYKRHMQRAKQ